jgi:hypothetical protein
MVAFNQGTIYWWIRVLKYHLVNNVMKNNTFNNYFYNYSRNNMVFLLYSSMFDSIVWYFYLEIIKRIVVCCKRQAELDLNFNKEASLCSIIPYNGKTLNFNYAFNFFNLNFKTFFFIVSILLDFSLLLTF